MLLLKQLQIVKLIAVRLTGVLPQEMILNPKDIFFPQIKLSEIFYHYPDNISTGIQKAQ